MSPPSQNPIPPPRSPTATRTNFQTSQSQRNGSINRNSKSTSRYLSSRSTQQRRSSSNRNHQSSSHSNHQSSNRTSPLSPAALAKALSSATETRFSYHGRYISKHPVRVLLLCSLVITSLFYPAVGIYFWSSKGGPGVTRGDAASVWRSLSTPFMDSFISGREHHNSIRDLRMIWDDAKDLRAMDFRDSKAWNGNEGAGGFLKGDKSNLDLLEFGEEDEGDEERYRFKSTHLEGENDGKLEGSRLKDASRPSEEDLTSPTSSISSKKKRKCRTVRIEHVFVTADDILKGSGPRNGVLQIPILSSALQLQRTIEAASSYSPNLIPQNIAQKPQAEVQNQSYPTSQEGGLYSDSSVESTSRPRATSKLTSSSRASASSSHLQCVLSSPSNSSSSPSPSCLSLSPLDYYLKDQSYLNSLSSPEWIPLRSDLNKTVSGIPLSITSTLAGRWHLFSKLPRAEHLALTFFLEVEGGFECDEDRMDKEIADSRGKGKGSNRGKHNIRFNNGYAIRNAKTLEGLSPEHSDWMRMLRNVTNGQVRIIPSEHSAPKEVLLNFTPTHPSAGIPFPQVFLAAAYGFVLIYIIRGLINTRRVHSRFGIAFTGATELLISMIMSISLCALLGIRLNLVPWEILPFVIVVVGSENMSVLIEAIVNTPVSLNVPSRIAKGLRKVAVPITVTVFSDIFLLICIAFGVNVGAVREFCIFAILSLIMDYFMQMTFFITVLSIDMQRLELADLLSQGEGRSLGDSPLKEVTEDSISNRKSNKSSDSSSFIKTSARAVWRARTARTASLSLMLALMFGLYLYYGTGYPMLRSYAFNSKDEFPNWMPSSLESELSSPNPITPSPSLSSSNNGGFDPLSHLGAGPFKSIEPWWASSPSASFWAALNPDGSPQVKIIIEPWTILSLRAPNANPSKHVSFAGWALFRPRIRAFIWFAKLVVLPIAGTTGLLWGLLLYLLKDTDMLAAQDDKIEADTDIGSDYDEDLGSNRDRQDEDGESRDFFNSEGLRNSWIDLVLSKASFETDIDLIAESDGVVLSSDVDSNLGIWRSPKRSLERFHLGNSSFSKGLGDQSRVTALAVHSRARVIAVGQSSGQVTLISLASLKPFWSASSENQSQSHPSFSSSSPAFIRQANASQLVLGLNSTANHEGLLKSNGFPNSRVQFLATHERNALERSQSVSLLSIHKDGSAWEWLPGGGSPQLRINSRAGSSWIGFEVEGSGRKSRQSTSGSKNRSNSNTSSTNGRSFMKKSSLNLDEREVNSVDGMTLEEDEEDRFYQREMVAMASLSSLPNVEDSKLEIFERDDRDEAWRLRVSVNSSPTESVGIVDRDRECRSQSGGQFKCAAVFELKVKRVLPSTIKINGKVEARDESEASKTLEGKEEDASPTPQQNPIRLNGEPDSSPPTFSNSPSLRKLRETSEGPEGLVDAEEELPPAIFPESLDDTSFSSSSTSPSTLTPTSPSLVEVLATGSTSGRISIFNFSGGNLINSIDLNDGPISRLRFVSNHNTSKSSCVLLASSSNRTWVLQIGSIESSNSAGTGSGSISVSNSGNLNLNLSLDGSDKGFSPASSPRLSNGRNGSKRPSSPNQTKVNLPQSGSSFLLSTSNLTTNSKSGSNSAPPRSPSGHSRSGSHQSNNSNEVHLTDSAPNPQNPSNSSGSSSNLLSFPLSSHGASRRRLSDRGVRTRTLVGDEPSAPSSSINHPLGLNLEQTASIRDEKIGIQALGFVSTFRGGFDLIDDSILIGVRRFDSSFPFSSFPPTNNNFSSGIDSTFSSSNHHHLNGNRFRNQNSNQSQVGMGKKWQAWSLDLKNELDISSPSLSLNQGYSRLGNEIRVKSNGLVLTEKDLKELEDLSCSNYSSSSIRNSAGGSIRNRAPNSSFNSDADGVARFQSKPPRFRRTDSSSYNPLLNPETLSFNELKPVLRTNGKHSGSLIFGFGNSIARLGIKEEELERRKGSVITSSSSVSKANISQTNYSSSGSSGGIMAGGFGGKSIGLGSQ